jgi:hypothetical protein
MPEFTTVSVQEALIRTIPGRQGQFINEYADYIQQLPRGQAGKLTIGEDENHIAVRRRLTTAAKAMNITLIIKRSGTDLYFWREEGEAAQPPPRRGRRSRNGRPGSFHLPQFRQPDAGEQEGEAEESTPLDQTFTDIE